MIPGPAGDERLRAEPSPPRGRRIRVPARVAAFVTLLGIVLVVTSSGSIRSWWAHRLHDLTGGSRPGDYAVGLAVGLLPLIGVVVGALWGRRRGQPRIRRVLRMVWFGAAGFVITYLLSPAPAHYIGSDPSTRVFDVNAPGYLAGVFTGAVGWLVALVLGVLRARAWWRRLRSRHQAMVDPRRSHRIIDV